MNGEDVKRLEGVSRREQEKGAKKGKKTVLHLETFART